MADRYSKAIRNKGKPTMNMLLLTEEELATGLPLDDRRAQHIQTVLKKKPGDSLLAGLINRARGKATIREIDAQTMHFEFVAEGAAEPNASLTLLLGFPRPIQAKRIFKDLTSLGVARIILSGTELGEKSYIESNFFKNDEYQAALLEGAEQAAQPLLPRIDKAWTLARALELLRTSGGAGPRWALDPRRGQSAFGALKLETATAAEAPLVLAIGSERGWTAAELDQLAAAGFGFATLGRRILKSETACLVAVSLALAKLGLL